MRVLEALGSNFVSDEVVDGLLFPDEPAARVVLRNMWLKKWRDGEEGGLTPNATG